LFSISFIFLSIENYGVRKLEAVFAVLITTMACSFAWMFAETKPSGKDLIIGEYLFLIDFGPPLPPQDM
jgi:Mn2+/Fe2+ NRAMP family transporter